MPRTPRCRLPAGPFHAMSHAVEGQALFLRPFDFRRYLGLLQLTVERYEWRLYTFVLMPNHVHLLVAGTPEQLSGGLWWLNWQFAEYYKAEHRPRFGHVFSGRPKLKPITTDAYFLAVARYIARNPAEPDEYRWSAHRAIVGSAPSLPFLARAELLRWFGPGDAADRYARFVYGEAPSEHREVRRWARTTDRPPLETLLRDPSPAALAAAHFTWDYPLRSIAEATGMTYYSVRQAINRGARPPD